MSLETKNGRGREDGTGWQYCDAEFNYRTDGYGTERGSSSGYGLVWGIGHGEGSRGRSGTGWMIGNGIGSGEAGTHEGNVRGTSNVDL